MKNRTVRYKVRGRAPFPIDMLRYDHVYPAHETESHKIDAMLWDPRPKSGEAVTIEVEGRGCTPARWQSFLWQVVDDIKVGV